MGSPRGTSPSSSCMKLGEVVGNNSGILELTSLVDIWYHSTSPRLLWLVVCIGCSRTPYANPTLSSAGSHHKMGQERPSHELSRLFFGIRRDGCHGVYHRDGSYHKLVDVVDAHAIPRPWAVPYVQVQKSLRCPKQLERYNDKYEIRGKNTR